MNLGIAGRHAIVCSASRGLGRACAAALAAEGVSLTIAARTAEPLEATRRDLESTHGVAVRAVVADLATEAGREALLAASPAPDMLVNNCGGAPPGDFRNWDRDDWIRALDANMLSAIFLIRGVVDGMKARGFGRIVNITNIALKGGFPDLGLSAGATAGLTGFVAALSRQTAAFNVTINNLLPGRFDTERLAANIAHDAARTGRSVEELRAQRLARQPVQRFGDPVELGAFCAFLCAAQAGYVTGQNIAVDGGAHEGTF